MRLYLAEKPSQIKTFREALKKKGMLNSNVEIVPLVGHVLEQKNFGEINPAFKPPKEGGKGWVKLMQENEVPFFPSNPFDISYKKVSVKTKDAYKKASEAIKKADEIVLITDPDNEGATLGMEVIEKNKAEHKVIGMINMSKLDVKSLIKEIDTIDKIPYKNMYDAGRSRALFDMLFGFNATIAATTYLGKGALLNIGAVKLPIIRMVVERDLAFENHKKIPYYVVTAKGKTKGKEFDISISIKDTKKENITKELSIEILETIKKNPKFILDSFVNGIKKTEPPKPYSLANLQSIGNKKYKLSAKKVLETLQSLYETHKVTSYPRTDSNYYAEGDYSNAKDYLQALATLDEYKNIVSKLDLNNLLKRKIFDDSKIEAHTALSVTSEANNSNILKLSPMEKNIFDLVATRYIIQFYPDYEYLHKKGIGFIENIEVTFEEKIPYKLGWREIVDTPSKVESIIPDLQKGDEVEILVDTITIKEEFTKPKGRFTEASLITAMERIHTVFDDPKIKKILKDSGIGTPATRGAILEDLKKKDKTGQAYFKVEKGKIISTPKARNLIKTLPQDLSSPLIRANFEEKLNEIVKGNYKKEEFLDETIKFVESVIEAIKGVGELYIPPKYEAKETGCVCPLCGGKIIDRGKIYGCENAKYENKKNVGCPFFIIKESKINVITLTDLKNLLDGKSVETPKARLTLDLNNPYYIKAEWKSDGGTQLDNGILETPKTFKLGEKFIWKNIFGKNLTPKQAKDLLEGKEVTLKRKSKAGKDYKVKVKYDGKGGVENLGFVK